MSDHPGGKPLVLLSDLRYAWIGGAEDERRFSFKGQRFLRARLVDLDVAGRGEPMAMPAVVREHFEPSALQSTTLGLTPHSA